MATEIGTPVMWLMGNHHQRGAFRAELLDGAAEDDSPVYQVLDIRALRIVAIDSTVPGYPCGQISADQLHMLAAEPKTPAPHGTLLPPHHPPLPSPIGLDRFVGFTNPGDLAEVVRGTDVRGILAGHYHYSSHGLFEGIPVSVASALRIGFGIISARRLRPAPPAARPEGAIQVLQLTPLARLACSRPQLAAQR